jgi:RNA polymerase sigma-54 factor
VADHLKDVEMNRLPQIARRTELTIDQIKTALGRLRRLDPHPGKQLVPDAPQVIVPDVVVEYDPVHDCYVAGLARGRTPSLRISPQYAELTRDRGQEKSTRDFLSEKMNNARWLIDSIDQRNNTLLRVVNAVLDVQRDFFDQGPEQLKPLPMIQVADQLGIHVGTVSRAVSEKYMQTPRGIFPLRMFFSGGTESQSGEEMSWAAVQAKLKQIVESEDPKKPWSDEELAKQLSSQGIDIARRTVAKYRQQMNIPPARRRRQY